MHLAPRFFIALATFTSAAASLPAQAQPAAAQDATAPATSTAPAAPSDAAPEVRALLTLLQDRKETLKDFTAKIDYSVEHADGTTSGKIGTVNYTHDDAAQFSATFTKDTEEGKVTHKHQESFILDGKSFTHIDFLSRQFQQQPVGGDPTSLDGPVPLPIGLKTEEVLRDFSVTLLPSPAPQAAPHEKPATPPKDRALLRLIPRLKGKYDWKSLEVTIDKTLQLPIKIVSEARAGDTTTIQFLDPEINTGKARIADAAPPTDPGWTIEKK